MDFRDKPLTKLPAPKSDILLLLTEGKLTAVAIQLRIERKVYENYQTVIGLVMSASSVSIFRDRRSFCLSSGRRRLATPQGGAVRYLHLKISDYTREGALRITTLSTRVSRIPPQGIVDSSSSAASTYIAWTDLCRCIGIFIHLHAARVVPKPAMTDAIY